MGPTIDLAASVLGVPVRLVADGDVDAGPGLRRLAHLFDMFPGMPPGTESMRTYRLRTSEGPATALWCEGACIGADDEVARLVPVLVADLVAHAVASFRGFAAHAAVVTTPTGTVALLGESGAGKSTLTAACLQEGFGYGSDEALCLEHGSATVVPFPKPISLLPDSPMRPSPTDLPDMGLFHADELGGSPDACPPPVRHVVVLQARVPGQPSLAPAEPAEGVRSLLSMGFNHFKAPDAAVAVAAQVARGAQTWTLQAGDPRATARELARQLRLR